MVVHASFYAIAAATLASLLIAQTAAPDAAPRRSDGLASKKSTEVSPDAPPLLATLVQTHTDERIPLDDRTPTETRFEALLADRATASTCPFDPQLLDLLRTLAARHSSPDGAPRIELVSGYRSAKLNEMMRKKGHHVASHSQHSLGHAVDFRIVDPGAGKAIDPRSLEREIRAVGWTGGVGIYTDPNDWFVHADVGPNRRWRG